MARGLGWMVVLVLATVGALVVVWAVWLLFTPDP
jgi:hypothetical protein